MRPKTITVTSGNSPFYFPLNYRGGEVGITATPAGSGDYDVAYTHEPIGEGADNVSAWVDADDMSAATDTVSKSLKPATALRITLNSGTSVTVDIVQSDV